MRMITEVHIGDLNQYGKKSKLDVSVSKYLNGIRIKVASESAIFRLGFSEDIGVKLHDALTEWRKNRRKAK